MQVSYIFLKQLQVNEGKRYRNYLKGGGRALQLECYGVQSVNLFIKKTKKLLDLNTRDISCSDNSSI